MRLIQFELNNYRRFEKSKINLDGDVIAIVGPNEAGKSSLLRAILHLNSDTAFTREEITRGISIDDSEIIIRARFLLDASDSREIEHNSAHTLRWLIVSKRKDGTLEARTEPELTRDLEPRQKAVRALERLLDRRAPLPSNEENEFFERMLRLRKVLSTRSQTLEPEAFQLLQILEEELATGRGRAFNRYLTPGLSSLFAELFKYETAPLASTVLFNRRPIFLWFGDEERSLSSSYDLDEAIKDTPPTLGNLARLAGLNLVSLHAAIHNGDYGTSIHLIELANQRLKNLLESSWRQAKIKVVLHTDGATLRVLISNLSEGYSTIAERSDGLRAFLALMSFTSAREATERRPILLVDEAESHLHYDAQVDLVRVFTNQRAASQVIYTTHSAGCLPQDLGTGVRVIAPIEGQDRSQIIDWFWSEGPGFSPILLGMGATALAFASLRYAVLAEGASDLILLPTLLREVTGEVDLGFQVVPGISEVALSTIADLQLEAARIAYVVDGDQGGRDIRRKLVAAGIPKDHIVTLGAGKRADLTIEDVLDVAAYAKATNEELRRSYGEGVEIDVSDLPEVGRYAAVDEWCQDRGMKAPKKRAVAYRVIELKSEQRLTSPDAHSILQQLFDDCRRILGL